MPLELPATVPILGKPFEILTHHAMVMIRCLCDAKQPLLLIGKGSSVRCPGCKNRYVLVENGKAVVGLVSDNIAAPGVEVPH